MMRLGQDKKEATHIKIQLLSNIEHYSFDQVKIGQLTVKTPRGVRGGGVGCRKEQSAYRCLQQKTIML
jgi:hypothetical protein